MSKLAELKGERTFEVIADIADAVINIAEDEETAGLFGKKALPENMTVKAFMLSRLRAGLPKLLRTHKDDVVTICAAVEGVSKEEYLETLTFEKAVINLAELYIDEVFNAFFI